MRCLAIAQGFKKRRIRPAFYLRGDPDANSILKGFAWKAVDWLKERVDVKNRIVIIDSYHVGKDFCERIYKEAKKVLFIDDNNRIPYPGGVVLNSAILAEDMDYSDNPKVKYLLGTKYHPLRREFWEVPVKAIRKRVERVLVTFGGSDMADKTLKALKILKARYPDIKKSVIAGRGFSDIDHMKTEADKNTTFIYGPDARNMKREMLKADICISGGGQTTYELARLGVPTIGICFTENQRDILEGWKKAGFMEEYADWLGGTGPSDKIERAFLNLMPFKRRKEIYLIGRHYVDGKGSLRLVESVL